MSPQSFTSFLRNSHCLLFDHFSVLLLASSTNVSAIVTSYSNYFSVLTAVFIPVSVTLCATHLRSMFFSLGSLKLSLSARFSRSRKPKCPLASLVSLTLDPSFNLPSSFPSLSYRLLSSPSAQFFNAIFPQLREISFYTFLNAFPLSSYHLYLDIMLFVLSKNWLCWN